MKANLTIKEILDSSLLPCAPFVNGWVRTHRQSKNVSFIELNDGSSIKGLQLVLTPETNGYASVSHLITTGASVRAFGKIAPSPAKGQKYEYQVEKIELIGEAPPDTYPLQKKRSHAGVSSRNSAPATSVKYPWSSFSCPVGICKSYP